MKKIVLASLVSLAICCPASASTVDGTPHALIVRHNGVVLFNVTGTRAGTVPACASPSVGQRFAFDASTAGGQALLSGLMTAIARGKQVSLFGAEACSVWGDTESVVHILFGE